MSNKYFWNEVINGLDEKLTDNVANELFSYQKRNDVELSDCIVEGAETAKGRRKGTGFLALVACIAVMVCLAVLTVVIVKNNIAVQPLDSTDEYSYLLEDVEYTHSTKVYFLDKELGREFVSNPEIIKNKSIANSIKTYLFAGNFDEEYYVFGDIENADNLNKIRFDDPIGGKTGMFMEGWDIAFNPELLSFVCKEESIREFCDTKYKYGTMNEKVQEITDVFIVCIPEYPALIHFKDGDKVYFINFQKNIEYGDGTSYGIFTHKQLADKFEVMGIPVYKNFNEDGVIEGAAVGDGFIACEVNMTKLIETLFDDEFIVRDGNKTLLYMLDMSTAEKRLYATIDSEAQTIEAFRFGDPTMPVDPEMWNEDGNETRFRQGELYMNTRAADRLLMYYDIMLQYSVTDDGRHINLIYNETRNPFTSDINFIAPEDFGFSVNDTNVIYTSGGKLVIPFKVRVPYAEIYRGMPVDFEFTIENNGVPVQSYRFTHEIKTMDMIVEDTITIDTTGLTFNEYGYSTGLNACLKYTLDATEIISGKIETDKIERPVLVRNNPDNLTEEELIATNPLITKCEKRSDGDWDITIDFSRVTETKDDLCCFVRFIDEKSENTIMMSNKVENKTFSTSFVFGDGEKPVVDIVLHDDGDEPKKILYMCITDESIPFSFYYRENFILTD